LSNHEGQVADRAELVVVARRPVVDDRQRERALPGRRELAEPVGELRVRDDVDVVDPFDFG
jgi:hypothetical protein